MVPSFFTSILPVPGSSGTPQKVQTCCSTIPYRLDIFFASRSVSRSIMISPSRMGPTVLRVMIRPLLLPSRIRHFTCIASPCMPVEPTTSITSAGVASSAIIDSSRLQRGQLLCKIVDRFFSFAGFDNCSSSRSHVKTTCSAYVILLVDEDIRNFLLIAERSKVHYYLFRLNVSANQYELSDTALNGFCCFVRSLLNLSCIPCNFKGFKRLVLKLFRSLCFYVTFCHNSPHSGVECSFITHKSAMMQPYHFIRSGNKGL